MPCATTSSAALASVVSSTRCCGVVARLITATGSSGDRPPSIRCAAIRAMCLIAI